MILVEIQRTKKAWQVCVYPSGLSYQGMRRMIMNRPNIILMATLYYTVLGWDATHRFDKIPVTVVSFLKRDSASHLV
jgi:hypothetical protein